MRLVGDGDKWSAARGRGCEMWVWGWREGEGEGEGGVRGSGEGAVKRQVPRVDLLTLSTPM